LYSAVKPEQILPPAEAGGFFFEPFVFAKKKTDTPL
jgi:hypothetical protein